MEKKYTEPTNVCIRIPPGLRNAVDEDVAMSGDFNSPSQWYLAAIRHFLDVRQNNKDRLGGGGA